MGYFSNSTEGMLYEERYCANGCVHYNPDAEHPTGCPVWWLHWLWNYDAAGQNKDETKEIALQLFIPRAGIGNEECNMRYVLGESDAQVEEIVGQDARVT
jgi:hypothetical protein